MYWEAHSFSNGFVSFTTNGFFDKEGYEEPQISATALALANLTWLWWVIGCIVLLVVVSSCYFCKGKKKTDSTNTS
jgi:hypothetical protein